MSSAEHIPGDVPSIEEAFGFDPDCFVGGTFAGLDAGMEMASHIPVMGRVARICFAWRDGRLMFQVFLDSDGVTPTYELLKELVSVQPSGNRLHLTMPYVGSFTITTEKSIVQNMRFIANAELARTNVDRLSHSTGLPAAHVQALSDLGPNLMQEVFTRLDATTKEPAVEEQ